ncbi:hypothetical protein FM106_03175 [Brachybacterium faecium]|nr:hypothetical protein FM106_03175 [Brachybacterium faecium]
MCSLSSPLSKNVIINCYSNTFIKKNNAKKTDLLTFYKKR